MPSTYTGNLRLTEQATGENTGTWGTILNAGTIALIDSAVAGLVTIPTTGGTTILTSNDGASDQARSAILEVTGTLTSNATIVAPSGDTKIYAVYNNTSGAFTVSMSAGGATIAIPQGSTELCFTDGTNFYLVGTSQLQGSATGPIDMGYYLFDRPQVKRYEEFYTALGSVSGALSLDYFAGNVQSMTLTGNTVITLADWPASGFEGSMTLYVTQDATGTRTLSFSGATVLVPGGGGLVLTTTANATDVLVVTSHNGGSTLYVSPVKNFS